MKRVKNIGNHLVGDSVLQKIPHTSKYHWNNWACSQERIVEDYYQPENLEQIQAILKKCREGKRKVKVVGACHSPNDIAATTDLMINLDHFNRVLHLDKEKKTVKVEGGIRLFELNEILLKNGLAMNCIGSISDQSIAGVISSGTHGTGMKFGMIATQCIELDLLLASGDILTCSESLNRNIFKAAQCGLGALGIILHVTVQCESAFTLHISERSMSLETVLHKIRNEDLLNKNEHFRFFWIPHTGQCYVWEANRSKEAPDSSPSSIQQFKDRLIGYHILQLFYWCSLFFPQAIPVVNRVYQYLTYSTDQISVKRSFDGFNFDCRFKQEVTEWAIPVEKTEEGVRILRKLIVKNGFKVHFPIEVRFVAKDDILLSPTYGFDACLIGAIMYRPYNHTPPFEKYFEEFEREMYHLGGRPHWSKVIKFTDFRFEDIYPKFNEFRRIREELDPLHMFENPFLHKVLNEGKL